MHNNENDAHTAEILLKRALACKTMERASTSL